MQRTLRKNYGKFLNFITSIHNEESFIACHWSYAMHKQFTADDFAVFERWVNRYVTNWASCDTLCNHTIGTLVEMYPGIFCKI